MQAFEWRPKAFTLYILTRSLDLPSVTHSLKPCQSSASDGILRQEMRDQPKSAKVMSEEKGSAGDNAVAAHVRSDKWAAALDRLGAEDRKRFEVTGMLDRSPRDILTDVLAVTNQKKNDCMRKRWKIIYKGRTVILRDVLEKITVWVNKFAVCSRLRIMKLSSISYTDFFRPSEQR